MRRGRCETGEPAIEAHDEVAAADLALAHDVDPGPLLVGDGEGGGVLDSLLDVGRSVLPAANGLRDRLEPAGRGVAPDHGGRDQR